MKSCVGVWHKIPKILMISVLNCTRKKVNKLRFIFGLSRGKKGFKNKDDGIKRDFIAKQVETVEI